MGGEQPEKVPIFSVCSAHPGVNRLWRATMPGMGTLYLVSTPIGNLEDFSPRGQRILSEVSLIAAEDTRHSRKLLNHFRIETPLVSYHDHSGASRRGELLEALDAGDLALISDSGTPIVSDPGYELVREAWERGHPVRSVPGPSAVVAALAVSGIAPDKFLFLGYLPRQRKPRLDLLGQHASDPWTLVAFEVPHRIEQAMEDLATILGAEREVAVCRELTKLHEQTLRGTIAQVQRELREDTARGEFTLVVAGAPEDERWEESRVRAALEDLVARGLQPSRAAREVAELSGWRKNDVYDLTLEE